MKPFSHLALGGGISMMGINLESATNVNRYANLRVSGNIFGYSVNDITTNGFTANGKLDLATMGASFDIYPWPNHGFRLSPGMLFYNQNSLTASAIMKGGQSFTLNGVDYCSSYTDPVHAKAKVGLNATNPSFTMTTGWGNMISRGGGHWSFPVELGAAFVNSPSFNDEPGRDGVRPDRHGMREYGNQPRHSEQPAGTNCEVQEGRRAAERLSDPFGRSGL